MRIRKTCLSIFVCFSVLLLCSFVAVGSGNSDSIVLYAEGMGGSDVYSNNYGYLKRLEDVFEDEHPDIDLKIVENPQVYKRFFWGDDLSSVPDVMILSRPVMRSKADRFGMTKDWYTSLFMDLTPYLETDKRLPELIDLPEASISGVIRSIPLGFKLMGFFEFNDELLVDSGLPSPKELYEKGEWTWDNFVTLSKTLTERGREELRSEDFYAWRGSTWNIKLIHVSQQLGGRIIDWKTKQIDPDGILHHALEICRTINDPSIALVPHDKATVDSFNNRYRSVGAFDVGRLGFDMSTRISPKDSNERWASVYGAIVNHIEELENGEQKHNDPYINERYLDMLNRLSNDVKRWSEESYANRLETIVPWPVVRDGQKPVFRLMTYWLAIPKQTENIELAWDLVECMLSSRVHLNNTYPLDWIPANLWLLRSEEYIEMYGADEIETIIQSVESGYEWEPPFEYIANGNITPFGFRLSDIYEQLIKREISVEEAYNKLVFAAEESFVD